MCLRLDRILSAALWLVPSSHSPLCSFFHLENDISKELRITQPIFSTTPKGVQTDADDGSILFVAKLWFYSYFPKQV